MRVQEIKNVLIHLQSVKLIEHFQVIGTMLINNHANRIIRRNELVQNPDMPK